MRYFIAVIILLFLSLVSGCSKTPVAEVSGIELEDIYLDGVTWLPESALKTSLGEPDLTYVTEAPKRFVEDTGIPDTVEIARPDLEENETGEYVDDTMGFTVTIPEGYVGNKTIDKFTVVNQTAGSGIAIEFMNIKPADINNLITTAWSLMYPDDVEVGITETEYEGGILYTAVTMTNKQVWYFREFNTNLYAMAMCKGSQPELALILEICASLKQ